MLQYCMVQLHEQEPQNHAAAVLTIERIHTCMHAAEQLIVLQLSTALM
jgi:hypothetical protein